MIECHCVTTMNKEYFDYIGKVMLKSWVEFFPKNYVLHLYLEDFTVKTNDSRIIVEDWTDVQQLHSQWDNTRGSSNARHRKFTYKACAQIAAWRKLGTGKLLWLDADLVVLKTIPKGFFDKVLEHYPLASWGEICFESGTVWFNLDHPDFQKIKENYEGVYLGDIGLPEGQRWFDGEILGWAVNEAKVPYKNLWCYATTQKTSTPLNRSWIGEHIQHFKAKRKDGLAESLRAYGRQDLAEYVESDNEEF